MTSHTANAALTGSEQNDACPDYSSHEQNAADLLTPDWRTRTLSADESAAVDAAAQDEYLHCEGH